MKTKPEANKLLHRALRLLGVPLGFLVVVALVWPSPSPDIYRVTQLERWIEPLQTTRFDREGFAELARQLPDFAAVQAQWQPAKLPDTIPLPATEDVNEQTPMARVWLQFRLLIPEHTVVADSEYAVFGNRMMGGAYTVWANGRLLHANVNDWPMQFNAPLYVTLPLEMTVAGRSIDILIAMPYRLNQGYAVGSIYAGPTSVLAEKRDWRAFWQKYAPQAATWVMLLMGALSLHLWLANRRDSANLILALMAVALFVCNSQFFYNPSGNETLHVWYNFAVDASVSWVIMLMFFFVFRFKQYHFPRVEKLLMLFVVAITLIPLPIWGWQKNALLLQHYFNIVAVVSLTGFVTWESLKKPSPELIAISGAVWLLTLFGIHDILLLTSQEQPNEIFLFPYAALAIATAFIFVSQRQHVDALKAVEQFSTSLSALLQDRERELSEKHLQLIAVEKSRTLLLERQRLVRDMHDGIGSALMTSLLMAEREQISPSQMADALRDCLDDLKAVIDSLEPMGNDLLTVLGTLRHRLAGRIESVGLVLIWRMGDIPTLPWLQPPQALHVLRIVQEALSNVLKHAKATSVEVVVETSPTASDVEGVAIRICDDGVGFNANDHNAGRGLRHMHQRVKELGGNITIESSPAGGTRLTVWLQGPEFQFECEE